MADIIDLTVSFRLAASGDNVHIVLHPDILQHVLHRFCEERRLDVRIRHRGFHLELYNLLPQCLTRAGLLCV